MSVIWNWKIGSIKQSGPEGLKRERILVLSKDTELIMRRYQYVGILDVHHRSLPGSWISTAQLAISHKSPAKSFRSQVLNPHLLFPKRYIIALGSPHPPTQNNNCESDICVQTPASPPLTAAANVSRPSFETRRPSYIVANSFQSLGCSSHHSV